MIKDTIAAIATAMSSSGIGIVRMSGPDSFEIIDRIFQPKKVGKKLSNEKGYSLHYGFIKDGEDLIDEVLVLAMRGPHSYTAEDTIEIDCHGGIFVVKKILETVIKYGARVADPGEFTKRAFLNGRIDLSQAEAVIDLIHATNEQAVKNSVRQLSGNLCRKIKEIRDSVLRDTAFIEAALDDPEHISLDGFTDTLTEHTEANLKEIKVLLKNAEDGKIIKEGIRTVILGKPNAGKSTLMNVLVGEERAIVTDIPGTTRDTLEEMIQIKGIILRIIDTAGIRHTQVTVEKIGVERAKTEAEGADFVIYVADASRELDENDEAVISMIQEKKAVVLLNKSDLSMKVTKEELEEKTGKQVFLISAKEETGMDAFAGAVEELFYSGLIDKKEEVFITNLRHKQALLEAKESLEKVMDSLALDMPEDFYSIDLMNAYQVLGEIIGEAVDEDLVDTIFKEFCMGK